MTKNRQVQTNIISYPDFKMTATMPKKTKVANYRRHWFLSRKTICQFLKLLNKKIYLLNIMKKFVWSIYTSYRLSVKSVTPCRTTSCLLVLYVNRAINPCKYQLKYFWILKDNKLYFWGTHREHILTLRTISDFVFRY